MNIELQSMAIELPPVAGHPNRVPFRGVLTLVGAPSHRPPSGAGGHRVLLTRAATERALPSLLGMALDYTPSLDAHDARHKVGVITEAEIGGAHTNRLAGAPLKPSFGLSGEAQHLTVAGYLYAHDFPDVVREVRTAGRLLGMSYEITGARVAQMSAPVWELIEFTFTGAALLRRDKAAYPDTWVELN